MTIAQSNCVVTAQGNGATLVWNYNFIIPYQADGVTPAIAVQLEDGLGNITVLSPSLYSVTGVGNPNGGTVVYPIPPDLPALPVPIPVGTSITISRALAYIQPFPVSNVSFYPHVVEQIADWIVEQVQQLAFLVQGLLVSVAALWAAILALESRIPQTVGSMQTILVSSNINLLAGNLYGYLTGSGVYTGTLPASAASLSGNTIVVGDKGNNASVHNITVTAQGSDTVNYFGTLYNSLVLDVNGAKVEFVLEGTVWFATPFGGTL